MSTLGTYNWPIYLSCLEEASSVIWTYNPGAGGPPTAAPTLPPGYWGATADHQMTRGFHVSGHRMRLHVAGLLLPVIGGGGGDGGGRENAERVRDILFTLYRPPIPGTYRAPWHFLIPLSPDINFLIPDIFWPPTFSDPPPLHCLTSHFLVP